MLPYPDFPLNICEPHEPTRVFGPCDHALLMQAGPLKRIDHRRLRLSKTVFEAATSNFLKVDDDSMPVDEGMIDIPFYLDSAETFEYLGFTETKARELWEE